jgi:hypothetical protein
VQITSTAAPAAAFCHRRVARGTIDERDGGASERDS